MIKERVHVLSVRSILKLESLVGGISLILSTVEDIIRVSKIHMDCIVREENDFIA